jgi:hypothetical protein
MFIINRNIIQFSEGFKQIDRIYNEKSTSDVLSNIVYYN